MLGLAIVAGVALIWLSIAEPTSTSATATSVERAAQTVLLAVLWGLLGISIGALVQSQVAALVGTLIWVFLVETLLIGIFGLVDVDGLAPYLPFQALDAADGSGGPDLLSYWAGVGVSLAWIAGVGAAGVVRVMRRDIT